MATENTKIIRFLASGLPGFIDNEEVRRTVLVNAYSSIGLLFFLFFGFVEYQEDNFTLSFILFGEALIFFVSIIFISITKKSLTIGWLLTITVFLLMPSILIFSPNITTVFWVYSFPVISIVVVGRRAGLVLSIILLLLCSYLIITSPFGMPNYYKAFQIRFIATYISTLALMVFSEYIRYLTNVALNKTNAENSVYMDTITAQRDEILAQKDLLEGLKPELEKLSIVASETDNAVVIASKEGEIEWINGGFERMFGFKLHELKAQKGNSIFNLIGTKNTNEIIKTCVQQKKSLNFEIKSITKNKVSIWTKKEITPILDNQKQVTYLVTIDTDITKIKEVEQEIRIQNAEIIEQKKELEIQNIEILKNKNEVSQRNEYITAGINYASTILEGALISEAQIAKYFQNFIVFKPKEIVSGDFYWFAKLEKSKFCFAIIDNCQQGVSGAFMSLVAGQILSETVIKDKIQTPGIILEQLINKKNKILENSKTKASILVIDTNNDNEISLKMASNSNMTCISTDNYQFTEKEVDMVIEKGTMLYLFSDGILKEKIRPQLIKIRNLPLNIQKQKIIELVKTNEQTDDITIIGIKIDTEM